MAKLNERVTECEAVLREDVYRDEFALLSKRLELLSADAEAAEAELKRPVSTDAARSGIMNMARSLNEQQRALDAERASIEGETARLRDVARDLDEDMARREGGEGREASYDALFRHDEEMTEFIDRFPATKEKEQAEQAVRLLFCGGNGLHRGGRDCACLCPVLFTPRSVPRRP